MRAGSFLDSEATEADGTATFLYGPDGAEGTYISTVTGVTKDGWTYQYWDNAKTSESLHVS